MIHYQLQCGQAHEFDGWFSDSAGYEKQAALGLIACPICADTSVRRALMAPSLGRRKTEQARGSDKVVEAVPVEPGTPDRSVAVSAPRMPDHVRAMLQRVRAEVERNCDYVGPSFTDEARRMHRGESERRGIYGETTPEQAESLTDEGIEFGSVPWIPRADG